MTDTVKEANEITLEKVKETARVFEGQIRRRQVEWLIQEVERLNDLNKQLMSLPCAKKYIDLQPIYAREGGELKSMGKKAETIDQFLEMLRAKNCNKVSGETDLEELFGKNAPFAVVCNKCGSMDVTIFGEKGIDYGGETGYCPGETVIKCNNCGSAATVSN